MALTDEVSGNKRLHIAADHNYRTRQSGGGERDGWREERGDREKD